MTDAANLISALTARETLAVCATRRLNRGTNERAMPPARDET